MRITFGALFIAIGVSLLWLAATGNLDRLGAAWDVVTGKGEGVASTSAESTGAAAAGLQLPPLPNVPVRVMEMPNLPTLG